ncbi:MAG TPA: hypothetical protein PLY96_14235 [Chromatiaceae bacterium]|nr:hypothetical protein [Chromatiaceae bacterium]
MDHDELMPALDHPRLNEKSTHAVIKDTAGLMGRTAIEDQNGRYVDLDTLVPTPFHHPNIMTLFDPLQTKHVHKHPPDLLARPRIATLWRDSGQFPKY